MGLRIKTNVQSLISQRQLSDNRAQMEDSLQKLSSGLRINKSADDAAGLAVSETIRAKVRGLGVAKRNASDGISFLQVAEGGLSELNNIVIRMRELTTQAASDTIGATERGFLNQEFTELGREVNRITDATEFNGLKILNANGDKRDINVQVGVNFSGKGENNHASEVISLQFDQLETMNQALQSLTDVNITGENGKELGGGSTEQVFQTLDNAMTNVTGVRASLGAMQSRLNSAITSIDVSSENLSAAQARIRDVDYASETARFTSSRILSAAGTSVLAQANLMPESVLQLLRN